MPTTDTWHLFKANLLLSQKHGKDALYKIPSVSWIACGSKMLYVTQYVSTCYSLFLNQLTALSTGRWASVNSCWMIFPSFEQDTRTFSFNHWKSGHVISYVNFYSPCILSLIKYYHSTSCTYLAVQSGTYLPVTSSECSTNEANGMNGLLTSHTKTELSRNCEQLK